MSSEHTIEEVDSDYSSCIKAIPPPSNSASKGSSTPNQIKAFEKQSCVWKYLKPNNMDGTAHNIFQVYRTPGGTNLCLSKLAIEKNGLAKIMLNQQHHIHKEKSNTSPIMKLIQTRKIAKKLIETP